MSSPLRLSVAAVAIIFIKLISPASSEAADKDAVFDRCIRMASGLAAEMPRGDSRNAALASLAWAYAHKGDVARVEFYASEIDDAYQRALTLVNVASSDGWRRRRPGHPTGPLLHVAIGASAKVGSPSLRDYVYWMIAIEQAAGDRIEDARPTMELIQSVDRKDGVLSSIATAYARHGDLEKAWATVLAIRPGLTRDRALQGMVFTLAKAGDVAAARGYAEHTVNPDSALSSIVRARAEAGDLGHALRLAQDITNPATRISALLTIAEHHGRRGQRDEAAVTYGAARSITETLADHRARFLSEIAVGQAEAGLVEDALATVDAFEALPDGTFGKTAYPLIWPLTKIARAQAKAGQQVDATAALERARRTRLSEGGVGADRLEIVRVAMTIGEIALARSIAADLRALPPGDRDPPPALAALQGIALGLTRSGDLDAAMSAVAEIDAVRGRDDVGDAVVREIALEQARRGSIDTAFETVAKIQDVAMRVRTLAEIAVAP